MTFSDILSSFKSYLSSQNISSVSQKNYLSDLNHFLAWFFLYLKSFGQFVDDEFDSSVFTRINTEIVSEYQKFLLNNHTPSSTVNRRFSTLRKFADFCRQQQWVKNDFTTSINNLPKNIKTERKTSVNLVNFTDYFERFAKQLNNEKTSSSTIKNYLVDIKNFIYWLTQVTDDQTKTVFEKVTPELLAEYQDRLLTVAKLSPRSINRKISSLRRFFNYLEDQGYLAKNPFERQTNQAQRIWPKIAPFAIFKRPNLRFGISKSVFAPQDLSQKGWSFYKKILFKLRYSRPRWYRNYNESPLASYFHWSILLIFCAGLGFGLYQQFTKLPELKPKLAVAPAAPPTRLSFQGRLTDPNGTPIASSTWFTFAIYNSLTASGSARLWNEQKQITPDIDGIFNTYLGDTTALSSTIFKDNTNLWLGVTVEANTEMTDRQQIATVGYAFNSKYLEGYPAASLTSADLTATAGAEINTIPVVNSYGNLIIAAASPSIRSTSGVFRLDSKTLYLTTDPTENGSIALNPGGTGTVNLFTANTAGNSLNATSSALLTGSLYYGGVANNNLGLKLLQLQSGSSLLDRFTVDALGGTYIGNNLNVIGAATVSGKLKFNSTDGDAVDIAGGLFVGTSDALKIDSGGQIRVGNFAEDPGVIGNGSIIYNTASNKFRCYINGAWADCDTTGGAGGGSNWTVGADGVLYPTNQTLDLLIGGTASTSADFAFLNVNSGTPTASFSGNLVLAGGARTISGTAMNALTIGNASTGDINFYSASNKLTSAGALTLASTVTANTTGTINGININAGTVSNATWQGNVIGLTYGGTNKNMTPLNGGVVWTDTDSMEVIAAGSTGQILQSGGAGAPSWVNSSATGTNYWTIANGAIYPTNLTTDLLIGGTATTSAKFAFLNVNSGTPVASFSGNLVLAGGARTITTTDLNNLTIGDANMQNLILNPAGNVGIGTTSPGAKLDVLLSTSGSGEYFQVSSSGYKTVFTVDSLGNVVLNGGDGAVGGGNITALSKINSDTSYDIYTATLDRGSGNGGVGFGLGYLFRLENGAGNRTDAGRFKYAWTVPTAGAETSIFTIQNKSAGSLVDALVINGGNVGIGTTNPLEKLDVNGNATVSGNLVLAGGARTISGTAMNTLTLGDASTGNLQFYSASNKLDSSGNLTLAGNLDINGTTNDIAGTLNLSGNTLASSADLVIDPTGGGVKIGTGTPGSVDLAGDDLYITGDLEVGGTAFVTADLRLNNDQILNSAGTATIQFNKSPLYHNGTNVLDNGNWLVENSTANYAALIVNQLAANDIFTASASGTTKFVITNAGNVGIGTAAPGKKLHILDTQTSGYNTPQQALKIDANTDSQASIANGFGVGIDFHASRGSSDNVARTGWITSYLIDGAQTSSDLWGMQFGIRDNDTERTPLTILNSGNIGVGTTGPDATLDILDSTEQLRLTHTDGTVYSGFTVGSDGTLTMKNTTVDSGAITAYTFNTDIALNTGRKLFDIQNNDVSKWSLDAGGASTQSASLTVGGASSRISNTSGDITISPTVDVSLNTHTLKGVLNLYASGKVGIGTAAPSSTLSVGGGVGASILTAAFYGSDTTSSNYALATYDSAAANLMYVRNDGYGWLKAASWVYGSDRRLKENIVSIDGNGLDTILKLNPVKFDYINGEKNQLGFIAQDVQSVIPEAVSVTDMPGETAGMLGLKTNFIIPYLVKGIQEQQSQISSLSAQLNNLFLDSTGDLEIKEEVYNGIASYSLQDNSGNLITRVLTAGQGIIANLKTGYLEAKKLVTENLIVSNRIISPLIEADDLIVKNSIVSPLIETQAIHLGGAEVVASSPSEVSLSGDLLVKGNLETQTATIASLVSEEIRAKKIFADEIVGATIAANYITNIYEATPSGQIENIDEIIAQIERQGLDLGPYVDIATLSAQLAFVQGDLKVLGYSSLASTSIAGMLTQDATLVLSEGRQIDVLGDNLYLQKMGLGGVDIADGKVVIDKEGNVSILGSLSVLGNLDVGSVEASGSATAKEFKIIREVQAELGAEEIIATSSAGKGTIKAGYISLTVKTPYAKENSLIYITPTSPVDQIVPYLARIVDGISFTVEIVKNQLEDINFNWLIIN